MGLFGFANEDAFDALIWKYAGIRGLRPALVKATIAKESGFNPRAYRAEPGIGDASRGLMQVLYKTAVWLGYRGDPDGLYDPETSIDYGTRYLAYQSGRYSAPADIYAAYNAGSVKTVAGGAYVNAGAVAPWLTYYQGYLAALDVPAPSPVPEPNAAGPPSPDTGASFWETLSDYTLSPDAPTSAPEPGLDETASLFDPGSLSLLAAAAVLAVALLWIRH